MNPTHPWRSTTGETKLLIKSEEKKWERFIDRIDEKDRKRIQEWNGQESADSQYEGKFEF